MLTGLVRLVVASLNAVLTLWGKTSRTYKKNLIKTVVMELDALIISLKFLFLREYWNPTTKVLFQHVIIVFNFSCTVNTCCFLFQRKVFSAFSTKPITTSVNIQVDKIVAKNQKFDLLKKCVIFIFLSGKIVNFPDKKMNEFISPIKKR